MVAAESGGETHPESEFWRKRLQELEDAHARTGDVYWRPCDEKEQLTLFSHNKETGKVRDIVAVNLDTNSARFIALAHDIVPHLLESYRYLAGYHNRRQRETFTS